MPDTPTTDDPAAETTSERIAVSEEDGRPLSELTDEELEIEATDLRSAVETITLDLLDDAKGDFWRSDDWRKRARAALGYKRADLRVCNLLLKQRQETRISKPAKPQLTKRQAREAKAQIHEATLRAELERKAHRRTMAELHLEELRLQAAIATANQQGKTERHRISEDRQREKFGKIIRAYKRRYGEDVYLAILHEEGILDDPDPDLRDRAANTAMDMS